MRVLRTVGFSVIGLALLAAMTIGVYRWDVAGSERPSDETLIKRFAAHTSELNQARCGLADSDAARARLSAVGVKFASCDYDNTLRLGFGGNTLGLAIGPGWGKGLTFVPGDPARHGTVVATTDGAFRLNAGVYLRPLGNGWFVWFQRDED